MEKFSDWLKSSGNWYDLFSFASDPDVLESALRISFERYAAEYSGGGDPPTWSEALEDFAEALELEKARRA